MIDTINKVYKNIYGVNLQQPFKIEGIRRSYQEVYPRYTPIANNYNSYSMMGGARRKSGGNADILYDSPFDYVCAIEDNLFMQWLNKFKLVHPALKPQSKTIIVRPSDSEIKKQIDEIKSAMKKDGITAGTAEDKEYIATHEMKAKQYLWNVFGTRDSKDNRGFEYGVNPEFPNSGSSAIIRRTARSGDVFYLKCESKGKITVGTDEKMKGSTSLEFLARCSNGCFVFKGVLPTPTEHTGSSTSSVSAKNGKKGKKRSTRKAQLFTQFVNKYHGDYDAAAYDFVGAVANTIGTKAVLPHYSSDFVHSAFEICFDDSIDVEAFDEMFGSKQIDAAHAKLAKDYVPTNTKMLDVIQARKFIDSAYSRASHNAHNGVEANRLFLKDLQDIYTKTSGGNDETLSADIASSMTNDNVSPSDIVSVVESMKDSDNDDVMSQEIRDSRTITTPMMNILKNKLSAYPFVGFVAKQSVPYISGKFDVEDEDPVVKVASTSSPAEPAQVCNDEASDESEVDILSAFV